jgi:hypothetical protein
LKIVDAKDLYKHLPYQISTMNELLSYSLVLVFDSGRGMSVNGMVAGRVPVPLAIEVDNAAPKTGSTPYLRTKTPVDARQVGATLLEGTEERLP